MKTKKKSSAALALAPEAMGEEIRSLVVEMSWRSKSGETGSALSISDILAVLYGRILSIDPKKPALPRRDRFILSKGHGAAALYATLALCGFFPVKNLLRYRVNDGLFHGHPSFGTIPGIEVSTGSLGHGLAIGAGMALALSGTSSKVYVLIGDGECNEGSIWEAALFIGSRGLSNIIAIVDDNKFQGFGATGETNRFDLGAQWQSFGWEVMHADGHDCVDLEKKFRKAAGVTRPTVLIARTVAGKGVPLIENTLAAHYFVADEASARQIRKNA
ncbi:MAG TPA: transketolase [Candidatus Paceibacterota bacterium]